MDRAALPAAGRAGVGGGIGVALAGLLAASCLEAAWALTASFKAVLCDGALAAACAACFCGSCFCGSCFCGSCFCGFGAAAFVARLTGCAAVTGLVLAALARAGEFVSFRAVGFWAAFLLAPLDGAIFCAM